MCHRCSRNRHSPLTQYRNTARPPHPPTHPHTRPPHHQWHAWPSNTCNTYPPTQSPTHTSTHHTIHDNLLCPPSRLHTNNTPPVICLPHTHMPHLFNPPTTLPHTHCAPTIRDMHPGIAAHPCEAPHEPAVNGHMHPPHTHIAHPPSVIYTPSLLPPPCEAPHEPAINGPMHLPHIHITHPSSVICTPPLLPPL